MLRGSVVRYGGGRAFMKEIKKKKTLDVFLLPVLCAGKGGGYPV